MVESCSWSVYLRYGRLFTQYLDELCIAPALPMQSAQDKGIIMMADTLGGRMTGDPCMIWISDLFSHLAPNVAWLLAAQHSGIPSGPNSKAETCNLCHVYKVSLKLRHMLGQTVTSSLIDPILHKRKFTALLFACEGWSIYNFSIYIILLELCIRMIFVCTWQGVTKETYFFFSHVQ